MNEAWRLYYQIKVYAENNEKHVEKFCSLEIYSEKYVIFNKQYRKEVADASLIIEPQTWSPPINDAWVMAHVHHSHCFRLLALPQYEPSFWDEDEKRPTALERELYQLAQAGYKPRLPLETAKPSRVSPLNGSGIFLVAPKKFDRVPIIQDAICLDKNAIIPIIQELQNLAQGRRGGIKLPVNALGYRKLCRHCNTTVTLTWNKDMVSNKWKVRYMCKGKKCLNSRGTYRLADV